MNQTFIFLIGAVLSPLALFCSKKLFEAYIAKKTYQNSKIFDLTTGKTLEVAIAINRHFSSLEETLNELPYFIDEEQDSLDRNTANKFSNMITEKFMNVSKFYNENEQYLHPILSDSYNHFHKNIILLLASIKDYISNRCASSYNISIITNHTNTVNILAEIRNILRELINEK